MGDKAAGDRGRVAAHDSWRPLVLPCSNAEAIIERRYGFATNDDVHGLLLTLQGYASRDRFPDYSRELLEAKRKEAHLELTQIIQEANRARRALSNLESKAKAFEAAHEYNPSLMRSVLDIDLGEPTELFPHALQPFYVVSRNGDFFAEADAVLAAIAQLPLKKPSGPAADVALRDAVGVCRGFWVGHRRSWVMSMLDVAERDDPIDTLKAECDRFLVDVLLASGFEFKLPDLRAAFGFRVKGRSKR